MIPSMEVQPIHGCPLLATDTIYNVRQRKTVPDARRPKWVHLFRRFVFLPFNRFCWNVMGVAPPEFRDGSWGEGQQSFTRIEDARDLIKRKGKGWYLEPSPLNGCLPDNTCSFDHQEIAVNETLYRNGSKVLPVAMPSEIATLQNAMRLTTQALNRSAG